MDELFDADNPAHTLARERLDTEPIAWLVTTTADGRPHPVPVWFLRHDGVISIVSEPDTIKMKHLRRGSQAVLHLEAGGPFGDDILVLRGDVRITPNGTSEWFERFGEQFMKKYDAAMANFGMPLEKYRETYSTLLEFTPTRVIAWGA